MPDVVFFFSIPPPNLGHFISHEHICNFWFSDYLWNEWWFKFLEYFRTIMLGNFYCSLVLLIKCSYLKFPVNQSANIWIFFPWNGKSHTISIRDGCRVIHRGRNWQKNVSFDKMNFWELSCQLVNIKRCVMPNCSIYIIDSRLLLFSLCITRKSHVKFWVSSLEKWR